MESKHIKQIIIGDEEIVSPNTLNPSMNIAGPFITLEPMGGRVDRRGDIWYDSITALMDDRKINRIIIDILKKWNDGALIGVAKNHKVNWTTLYIVLAMRWSDIEDELLAILPEHIRDRVTD